MKSRLIKPLRGTQLNKTHPLSRGLKAAWIFNEGTGQDVHDYSGNGNLGTFVQSVIWPEWFTGVNGTAIDFGTTYSEHIMVPDYKILFIPASYACGFIDVSTGLYGSLFSYNNNYYQNYGCWIQPSTDLIRFWHNGYSAYDASMTRAQNTYYNMLGTYDGSTVRIYLNGEEGTARSDVPNDLQTDTSPNEFHIGKCQSSYHFQGQIFYLYIWNRTLTQEEAISLNSDPYQMFYKTRCISVPALHVAKPTQKLLRR